MISSFRASTCGLLLSHWCRDVVEIWAKQSSIVRKWRLSSLLIQTIQIFYVLYSVQKHRYKDKWSLGWRWLNCSALLWMWTGPYKCSCGRFLSTGWASLYSRFFWFPRFGATDKKKLRPIVLLVNLAHSYHYSHSGLSQNFVWHIITVKHAPKDQSKAFKRTFQKEKNHLLYITGQTAYNKKYILV